MCLCLCFTEAAVCLLKHCTQSESDFISSVCLKPQFEARIRLSEYLCALDSQNAKYELCVLCLGEIEVISINFATLRDRERVLVCVLVCT